MGEIVIRPNGKLYRAKHGPIGRIYDDGYDRYGAVILRTHDVDVAVPLAHVEWVRWFDGRDPLPPAKLGWTRLVPWGPGGQSGEWMWDSCDGFEKGSIPCVWFNAWSSK